MSETFSGPGSINQFTVASSTGSTQPVSMKQVQVRYDVASSSYTISTGDLPDITFTPADRSATDSTAVITAYKKIAGTRTDYLALFNPGPANSKLALTYTSYGGWQSTTSNGTSLGVSTAFFVFGVKTAASDMPRTGSATYKSILDGMFAGSAGVYALGGSASLGADFDAGTVDFQMNPVGQNIGDGSIKNFGVLTGSGAVAAGGSTFNAQSDAQIGGSYASTLAGQFFGPQAAEFGATFKLTGPDGQGNGVMVGKKN